jgi:hypothetical protein
VSLSVVGCLGVVGAAVLAVTIRRMRTIRSTATDFVGITDETSALLM